jgi:CHAD domain-containing protein
MPDHTTNLEREVHLDAPKELRLPKLSGFTVLEDTQVELTAVYWDTSDRRLLGWGHTVRHRAASDGSESGWTVKLRRPGKAKRAVARDEIFFDGDPTQPPAGVCSLLRAFIRHEQLQPVVTIVTDRRRQRLRRDDGDGVVEVADDRVHSRVGGDEGPSVREIEVELIEGDERLLSGVVRILRKAGLGAPDPASKLERVLGGRPRCEIEPVELTPRASITELVSAALSNSTRHLMLNDPGVRLGEAPEAIHQARVATRRLRSDLKSLLPLLDESVVDLLRDELRWLGESLGAVRDFDVFADAMCHLAEELDPGDFLPIESLVGQLRHERQGRFVVLRHNLDHDRYVTLIETLVGFASRAPLATPGDLTSAARPIGVKLARKAWKRVRNQVDGLGPDPEDAALHELRKRVKRARYAAELIDPLVHGEASGFTARLADLQDVLGELQDSVVADQWLRNRTASEVTPREVFAAGALHALEQSQRAETRRRWRHAWDKTRRAKLRSWMH